MSLRREKVADEEKPSARVGRKAFQARLDRKRRIANGIDGGRRCRRRNVSARGKIGEKVGQRPRRIQSGGRKEVSDVRVIGGEETLDEGWGKGGGGGGGGGDANDEESDTNRGR